MPTTGTTEPAQRIEVSRDDVIDAVNPDELHSGLPIGSSMKEKELRIALVCCGGVSLATDAVSGLDLVGLKLRGFTQILDAEQPHLPNSKAMIAELRSGFEELARRQAARP